MNEKWADRDGDTGKRLKTLIRSTDGTLIQLEIYPDGVKEVPCDFCDEHCGNDWCYTKDEE